MNDFCISGRRRRKVAELSQEEKEAIMMSDEFHKFFDRTTRLMERAMCEDHQSLFVDYTGKICLTYIPFTKIKIFYFRHRCQNFFVFS